MKQIAKIFIFLSIALFSTQFADAQSAQDILSKASSKLNGASSVRADFSMKINGQSCSGKLAAKGNKFVLTSSVGSSWYNGSAMWSYSPATGETTVFKPSTGEIMEANPLMYARNSGNFTATFSKNKTAGKHTIVLVPKSKGNGLKSVTLVLNASTYLPEKVIVTPISGGAVTVNISNIRLNASVSDSEFNYPKSKYPKAKIIDLR